MTSAKTVDKFKKPLELKHIISSVERCPQVEATIFNLNPHLAIASVRVAENWRDGRYLYQLMCKKRFSDNLMISILLRTELTELLIELIKTINLVKKHEDTEDLVEYWIKTYPERRSRQLSREIRLMEKDTAKKPYYKEFYKKRLAKSLKELEELK